MSLSLLLLELKVGLGMVFSSILFLLTLILLETFPDDDDDDVVWTSLCGMYLLEHSCSSMGTFSVHILILSFTGETKFGFRKIVDI